MNDSKVESQAIKSQEEPPKSAPTKSYPDQDPCYGCTSSSQVCPSLAICVVRTNGLTATRVINENDSGGYCVRDGVSITSSCNLSVLFFRFSPERLYEY